MLGGKMKCETDAIKRMCIYPFVEGNIYTDTEGIEYTFTKLDTKPEIGNANGLIGLYKFTQNGILVIKYTNNPTDVEFLKNLTAKL
jgi:hypothetical protein